MDELLQVRKPQWPFVLNEDCDQAMGLVGWWPGAAAGGNKLWDLSGKLNHGTLTNFSLTGSSGWAPGVDGGKGALQFNTSPYVNLDTAAYDYCTVKTSMAVWIKTADATAGTVFAGGG